MSHYGVYLGAVGWVHPQWRGSFYPEDLPTDWELPFYNTQFRCVYLPPEIWRNASNEEIARWLQETREDFRFVLQPPENPDENIGPLAERFGERGIPAGKADLLWLEDEPDMRHLAQHMQKAALSGSPLFLISRDGDLTNLRQVSELMEVLGV